MTNVSRNDLYARDERGPEWFNEFLQSLANTLNQPSSIQEILSAINNKKAETVAGVVQDYRERVGLDLVQSLDDYADDTVKQASVKTSEFRPLSIRHAAEQSIVDKIKADPEISSALESLCRHSGGTKKLQSLVTFLREKLGQEVSFSDDGLMQYLKECKEKFRENVTPDLNADHVGLVGTTDDSAQDRDDDVADYIKNDGAK